LDRYLISPDDNVNMVLDLTQGEKALFDKFGSVDKKSVLQAHEKGLRTREAQSATCVESYYELLARCSEGGKKFDIAPLGYMKELLDAGYGKLILAEYEGKAVGGQFLILAPERIFGWFSCYDRAYRKLDVTRTLTYHLIRWAIANHFKMIDFGQQSLSKEPKLVAYKRSYRPIHIPAYSYRIRRGGLRGFLIPETGPRFRGRET
jgi:lipid II:glycine glycyltransferase (peptidoglycan interpeptide bridge formation enzyme)